MADFRSLGREHGDFDSPRFCVFWYSIGEQVLGMIDEYLMKRHLALREVRLEVVLMVLEWCYAMLRLP